MLHPGLYLVTPDWPDTDALVAAVAALLPRSVPAHGLIRRFLGSRR